VVKVIHPTDDAYIPPTYSTVLCTNTHLTMHTDYIQVTVALLKILQQWVGTQTCSTICVRSYT